MPSQSDARMSALAAAQSLKQLPPTPPPQRIIQTGTPHTASSFGTQEAAGLLARQSMAAKQASPVTRQHAVKHLTQHDAAQLGNSQQPIDVTSDTEDQQAEPVVSSTAAPADCNSSATIPAGAIGQGHQQPTVWLFIICLQSSDTADRHLCSAVLLHHCEHTFHAHNHKMPSCCQGIA